MLGGDREARERGDEAYYRLPRTLWSEVEPDLAEDLRRVRHLVDLAVAELVAEHPVDVVPAAGGRPLTEAPPSPVQLAFRFTDLANRLWASTAGTENDLRQVITTLRTALAICWDLYSPKQAETTTVSQHMIQLRERIEDFERDLRELQSQQTG